MANCPKCNCAFDENVFFCPQCGERIKEGGGPKKQSSSGIVEKINENEFVKSVKDDFSNSKSIGVIKEKVKTINSNKNAQKKLIIILTAVIVFVGILTIVSNIHRCDDCDEVYFGKRHKITFFGESEYVCKDCYDDWWK